MAARVLVYTMGFGKLLYSHIYEMHKASVRKERVFFGVGGGNERLRETWFMLVAADLLCSRGSYPSEPGKRLPTHCENDPVFAPTCLCAVSRCA